MSGAQAETREAYLARLKEVCSVNCLQPREFQRKARKQGGRSQDDMAIIMDVAYVTRDGDTYQLHNLNLESSYFEDLQILGSAGINTSSSNGIGGLPRGRSNPVSSELIVVELDAATARDLLGGSGSAALTSSANSVASERTDADDTIVVEADREKKQVKRPSTIEFRSFMRGRRVVVRGKPRLQAVWVGARLDRRRKQVTLELDSADDLVLLPEYDSDGDLVEESLPWINAASEGNSPE